MNKVICERAKNGSCFYPGSKCMFLTPIEDINMKGENFDTAFTCNKQNVVLVPVIEEPEYIRIKETEGSVTKGEVYRVIGEAIYNELGGKVVEAYRIPIGDGCTYAVDKDNCEPVTMPDWIRITTSRHCYNPRKGDVCRVLSDSGASWSVEVFGSLHGHQYIYKSDCEPCDAPAADAKPTAEPEPERMCGTCNNWDTTTDYPPCDSCVSHDNWQPISTDKTCKTCEHEHVRAGALPCRNCWDNLGSPGWEPKRSEDESSDEPKVPVVKRCSNCVDDDKTSAQKPCCSCHNYSMWTFENESADDTADDTAPDTHNCTGCAHGTFKQAVSSYPFDITLHITDKRDLRDVKGVIGELGEWIAGNAYKQLKKILGE